VALDGTDFVDTDAASRPFPQPVGKAPTREELDARLTGAQQQLTKLRESHEQIEREIAAIEERRRRRAEFSQGLEEVRRELVRGTGLLEKAEMDARRQAEQLARTVEGLNAASKALVPHNESDWTAENWENELTRGLTAVENARMELNSARLKWPQLESKAVQESSDQPVESIQSLAKLPIGDLCRLGFGLTWPVGAVLALFLAAVVAILLKISR
jgi:chromosome segregation ATPase